jgi:NAD-dependent SIR2 family protein deacetylase
MTKFGCTTCWKTKDDKEIKWWEDKPVCERCYRKYLLYPK